MKRLLSLSAALALGLPAASHAIPILMTTSCDQTGAYTCLTRAENYEFGGEQYNIDFVIDFVLSAHDATITDVSSLAKLAVLSTLTPDEMRAFSRGVADLLVDNDIDGFACSTLLNCFADVPFGYTHIPVGYTLRGPGSLDVSACLAGRGTAGDPFSFCFTDPGSGRHPWAVVTHVPEPGTLALLGLGLAGLIASRRRR